MERDQFLGVELRHLAALEAVGRTRSFGRAARELGYTQSAISQQIARLERAVGQKLVDRPGGPRRVDLTEAGRLLLRHADAIVAQLDAAQADMAALAEGAAGPLRVGIYQSVGARILPGLLHRFQAEWPKVEVRVREETDAADLLRLLERGELDLTFADLPLPDGPFESAEVLRDPYVLIVGSSRTSPSAARRRGCASSPDVPLVGWRSSDEPETLPPRARPRPRRRVPHRRQRHADGPRRRGARRRGRAAARRQPAQPGRRRAAVRIADPAARDRDRLAPRPLPLGRLGGVRRLACELGEAFTARQAMPATATSSGSAASTSRRPAR